MNSQRVFEDKPAVRDSVPLLIGLVGPTGTGKSYSSLELATGIQTVTGGDIYVLDSEADRMLHYADKYKFRHVRFEAPFNPLSYLAGVEHCHRKGAKVVVIDSLSHMHEGPGGTLEAHNSELDRIAGDDWKKRNACTMLAWQKPKAEIRRFLNAILQMKINLIFCFRAKEKLKLERGKEPLEQGFMPIAGDEVFYEMTLSLLLHPGARGCPTLASGYPGESVVIKIPEQFTGLFRQGEPISRDHGRKLAEWSTGSTKTQTHKAPKADGSGYREAVAQIAQESGVDPASINRHMLAFCVKEGLCEAPEEVTPRSAINALSAAFRDHKDSVTREINDFCYADLAGVDEPGSEG